LTGFSATEYILNTIQHRRMAYLHCCIIFFKWSRLTIDIHWDLLHPSNFTANFCRAYNSWVHRDAFEYSNAFDRLSYI